jgi:streptogramin lyase
VLGAGAAVGAIALTRADAAPPEVLPTSVVRIDPKTLEPTEVVRVGPRADLVVVAGGYVWVTHGILRYAGPDGLRDAGDRTLTRVDTATGASVVVGGGLAPCGLTADPSGDVWVANCYASKQGGNVVRVDAKTLKFKARWPLPAGDGYYQALVYGGGSLWVADISGGEVESDQVIELNPSTGKQRRIRLDQHATTLAWSEGYGDLWMGHFADGDVSRLHARSGEVTTHELVAGHPASLVVQGDAAWVGDWTTPTVVRLPTVGSGPPRHVALPVREEQAGVTSVAAGAGAVWATVPDSHALWRIDPKSNRVTRIGLRYFPWGVAVGDDGIWVAVRAQDAL